MFDTQLKGYVFSYLFACKVSSASTTWPVMCFVSLHTDLACKITLVLCKLFIEHIIAELRQVFEFTCKSRIAANTTKCDTFQALHKQKHRLYLSSMLQAPVPT